MVKYALSNDPKEIKALSGPEDRWFVELGGIALISKIEAYLEDGDTVWFAIYRNDCPTGRIIQRINSRYVESVIYVEVKEDQDE